MGDFTGLNHNAIIIHTEKFDNVNVDNIIIKHIINYS